MYVAVWSVFAASKAEPLAAMLERVHAAFGPGAQSGGALGVRFKLTDHVPIANAATPSAAVLAEIKGMRRVSAVDRVLKRFPAFERFARSVAPGARGYGVVRLLPNLTPDGVVAAVDFSTLLEIARGVPKSFPFRTAQFHFSAPWFSAGPEMPTATDPRTLSMLMRAGVDIGAGHPTTAGIGVRDSWWVNGRQRSMVAPRITEGDPAAARLPAPPHAVAAVLAACGKVRKTMQVPVAFGAVETAGPPVGAAIRAVVREWRARVPTLLETLPHDLPQRAEVDEAVASAPKKPALVEILSPMGYDCRGEIGTFSLRRRTAGNLTVELELDVGTWNNALMAFFRVQGLTEGQGFKATLSLPPSPNAARAMVGGAEVCAQFPIGGPERWRRIVENLAVLVRELDRGFVPAAEAAAGASPAWYRERNDQVGRD